MSSIPNGPKRKRKAFDKIDFDTLHESVGGLDFTPDFNASLEAIIADDSQRLPERLLALVKLQAWGNQKLFAVHDDHRTRPFTRADACERLSRSTTQVYEASEKLVDRFLLRIEAGRLYPVADPAAERDLKKRADSPYGSDFSSPNLRHWLEAHPHEATRYQEAFEVIESIRKRFRAETKNSDTGGKNAQPVPGREEEDFRAGGEDFAGTGGDRAAASLYRSSKVLEEAPPSSSSPYVPEPVPELEPEAPEETTTTTIPSSQISQQEAQGLLMIRSALKSHGTPDPAYESGLWYAAKLADPKIHHLELAQVIREKVPLCVGKGFRYLTAAVLRALPIDRDPKIERATANLAADDPALARWRAEQEAALADPKVGAEEKHLIRLCLGIES